MTYTDVDDDETEAPDGGKSYDLTKAVAASSSTQSSSYTVIEGQQEHTSHHEVSQILAIL